jgi:hypothetical protein
MLKFLLTTCVALAMTAGVALADSNWGYNGNPAALALPIFTNQSTTATSTPSLAANYRYKTAYVQGVAVSGHTNTTLSGTVAAYCGPTAAGPFLPCLGLTTTAAGAAVSTTSNAALTWVDANQFVEFIFTKTSGEVSVWLSLGN